MCISAGVDYLEIVGEKGMRILFDCANPDDYLRAKSLVMLKTKEEIERAKKKPFIVTHEFRSLITFQDEEYFLRIPKGYEWNGANVPPFAWLLIGEKTDPRFMLASCLHDFLCEHHDVINNNRYASTLVFITCCNHFGKFPAWKLFAMKHSVDNFQKVCGKDLKGQKWKNL